MACVDEYSRDTRKHHFYPYAENGGTAVAICGDDFVTIASDSRLTGGYSILSRNQTKVFRLTPKTVLASVGCWADVLSLNKDLQARLTLYKQEHNEEMSTTAIAQLVSTLLYWKRFFPYYVSNTVAGVDEKGEGVCYHYDPVGHMEKLKFSAAGAAVTMIQPLLDNILGAKNMEGVEKPKVTKELARELIHDAFVSASERGTETGDGVELTTIGAEGISVESFKLRRD